MFSERLAKLLLPSGGQQTAIDPGDVALRVGGKVLDFIDTVTAASYFGPAQPLRPQAPEGTLPRVFDYPLSANFSSQPRAEESGPSFSQLRALADNCDLVRLVIETRKDQFEKMPWSWRVPKNPGEKRRQFSQRSEADPRVIALTEFFKRPDRQNNFQSWLRQILEEIFVTDALTIWPVKDASGKCLALQQIDGATIKPLHDTQGWRPEPPNPAYQQIVKGIAATNFTSDQLIYSIRNPRVNKWYGYSPCEQIIIITNLAIRRQLSQLSFYTSGNLPEMLIQAPETWTPQQIQEFQLLMDSLSGDQDARRRARMIPKTNGITTTKDAMLKDDMDEWLARVICYCFSVPPTPFSRATNRATAQSANESASSEGLLPLLNWTQELFTFIATKYMGIPGVEFHWESDEEADQLKQSQIDTAYISIGKVSIDEVRERDGEEPLGIGNFVMTGAGPLMIQALIDGKAGTGEPPSTDTAGTPLNLDPNKRDPNAIQPVIAGAPAKPKAAVEKPGGKVPAAKSDGIWTPAEFGYQDLDQRAMIQRLKKKQFSY